ncbi:hypothetical protein O3P69_009562 [Scylla paramamosain]|uniref:Ig-like domain-containing protein n=1 Tax=Scylla paramamosain TaxID=85552 RepID=A0AAW0SV17_SCYPA
MKHLYAIYFPHYFFTFYLSIDNTSPVSLPPSGVSWIRHRDTHLLTVGRFTYTSDARFSARHSQGSEDWLLMVYYLQERDNGMYVCQISTTPPMSHFVHLSVVAVSTSFDRAAFNLSHLYRRHFERSLSPPRYITITTISVFTSATPSHSFTLSSLSTPPHHLDVSLT